MAEVGTVTVKLLLDTTEFDAALERVKAALEELGQASLIASWRPEIMRDNAEAIRAALDEPPIWHRNERTVRGEARLYAGPIVDRS